MKTIAFDKSYIDYTAEGFGVRVWPGICRPIIQLRGRWTEYGVSYTIPVDLRQLSLQRTAISSLASNVSQVDAALDNTGAGLELRGLIAGTLAFDDALAAQLQSA